MRKCCQVLKVVVAVLLLTTLPLFAQQLAKRLILKDGSYQLATKWEVKGERVRYLSANATGEEAFHGDWTATDKYERIGLR
jgi:hypothetical protein